MRGCAVPKRRRSTTSLPQPAIKSN
jgi:hypothetical protein